MLPAMLRTPRSGHPTDNLEGQILDEKYRVERFLGQGGFGRVYNARHLKTETLVVLKFLLPNDSGGYRQSEITRFLFEAEVPARIGRGVIKCLDFYPDLRGKPCLVTEFIDGRSLEEVLETSDEGRLPLLDTLRIAAQVAATMTVAHDRNIVHRDLTPKNLLLPDLEPDPSRVRAKIIDWGIAREFTDWVSSDQVTASEPPGPYAPPESSRVIHPPADVFAFGVLLYQMLVGRIPTPRENIDPKREHDALIGIEGIPRRVRRVISRCLTSDPVQRMRMAEVSRELDKALEEALDAPRQVLQDQLHERQNQVHILDAQLQILTRQEKEREARLESRDQKLAQQAASLETLNTQLQQASQNLREMQQQHHVREQTLAKLTRDFEVQQHILGEHQQQANQREQALIEEVGESRQRIELLHQEGVQQGQRLQRLQTDLDVRARELESLRRELSVAHQASQQQTDALRTAEARLDIAQQRSEESEQLVARLKGENERLVDEYAQAYAKYKSFRQELEQSSQDGLQPLQHKVGEYQNLLERKTQEIQQQRARVTLLRRGNRWRNVTILALGIGCVGLGGVLVQRHQSQAAVSTSVPVGCPVCALPPPATASTIVTPQPVQLPKLPRSPNGESAAALALAPSLETPPAVAPPIWQHSHVENVDRTKLRLFDVWSGPHTENLFAAGAVCVADCGGKSEVDQAILLVSNDGGLQWQPHAGFASHRPAGRLYRGLTLPTGEVLMVGDGAMYRVAQGSPLRIPLRHPGSTSIEVLRGLWSNAPTEVTIVSASPGGYLFEPRLDGHTASVPSRKLPTGDSLYSIWGNETARWVVGTGGTILRQDRKTGEWKKLAARDSVKPAPVADTAFEKLYQVGGSGDHVLACGANERDGTRKSGVLYQTRDSGRTWSRTNLDQPCYGLGRLSDASFVLVGIGDHLVHVKSDGELETIGVPLLGRLANAKGVWGTDLDHLQIVGWDGLILRRGPG